MHPASWLEVLAAEIAMAPGFLATLDQQLRSHARSLIGVDDIVNGGYTLLPPDQGFTVQFRTAGGGVVGVIEGMLVDPSAFAHQVALGWRARGATEAIPPDQERDDLEFFWIEFPIAELSAGTHVDTSAAAAAVTTRFPVEWDVHQWESLRLVLNAHHAFTVDELDALNAAVQRAVDDWNAREPNVIDYLGEPQSSPDRAKVRWYLDLNVAGADAVVAVINALDAPSAASAIARCFVGRWR